jgi:putative transposase
MTNHVHLLLTPPDANAPAKLMHGIGHRYGHYFNRRYERSGTLWEGRFYSCLVDSSHYVLACHRYIEMNPVRAGMLAEPRTYRWSSDNGNTGHMKNDLLTPHAEVLALATDEEKRLAAYRSCSLERKTRILSPQYATRPKVAFLSPVKN